MNYFQEWGSIKEQLAAMRGHAHFHEREVWWCSLGQNIGVEENAKPPLFRRPVVILTKFNLDSCIVVPLSTTRRTGEFYLPLGKVGNRNATAVLSQVRLVDQRRLDRKISTLPDDLFLKLYARTAAACFPKLR